MTIRKATVEDVPKHAYYYGMGSLKSLKLCGFGFGSGANGLFDSDEKSSD